MPTIRARSVAHLQAGNVRNRLGKAVNVKGLDNGFTFEITGTAAALDTARKLFSELGLTEVGGPPVPPPPPPLDRRLVEKPYGFIPLPKLDKHNGVVKQEFTTQPPVWQDGTGSRDRISGEVRFELTNLTPMLVGWERQKIEETDTPWPIDPVTIGGDANDLHPAKAVLCPLRAPWGRRPVVIPGDSLKGLLRHEIGALLEAPMERVAERTYSYRPNAMHPTEETNRRLIPRLARVPANGTEQRVLSGNTEVRVPTKLSLLPVDLRYNGHNLQTAYSFPSGIPGTNYRGGLGGGDLLNAAGGGVHDNVRVPNNVHTVGEDVHEDVRVGYLNTLRHLTDLGTGHFNTRHPDVNGSGDHPVDPEEARQRIIEVAQHEAFTPGDIVWVEWDTQANRIVSLGWHYYYRWAYQDTVRNKGWTETRPGLVPQEKEQGDVPAELTAVRRLFGYSGDNDGSAGIGTGNFTQLMGRVSINAALEVVGTELDGARFIPRTFLKELGMPRPSAVELYLKQPYFARDKPRVNDNARLVTYGDAKGYDTPGELAGRKFYLDRRDAYDEVPWRDNENKANKRSTLALNASKQNRRFRFTLRFRDLDEAELVAILLALCPNQFKDVVGGAHEDGYCSKLGYARPLGWGSVRIVAQSLHLLDGGATPTLTASDPMTWFTEKYQAIPGLTPWLAIHQHKHPDATDYQRDPDDGEIYTFHTKLRGEHSRERRYRRPPA